MPFQEAGAEGNESTIRGMIDTLSDGTWTSSEVPDPPGLLSGGKAYLDDVSCPAVVACIALGAYFNQNSQVVGLYIETELNGSWSVAAAPMPPGDTGYTRGSWAGLSCPSIGACTAACARRDAPRAPGTPTR